MKFAIVRSKFLEALKSVQNIVPAKVSTPVMQNVKIVAGEGKLVMTTTSIDMSVVCEVECAIEEPGETTLPVAILSSMVACSEECEISVAVDEEQHATIRAGRAKYRLAGMDPRAFPSLPESADAREYSIPQALLKEMFRKTAYSVCVDDTRRALVGVFNKLENGIFQMVATDGRRLSLVEKDLGYPAEDSFKFILPVAAVHELQRVLSSDGDAVVKVQGTQIRYSLGNVTIYSKLIAEEYPNFQQVIPKTIETEISIDRVQLISAIERVSVMSKGLFSTALKFGDNLLVVSSSANEIGEAKDEVPVKYDGEEVKFLFDPSYLLDALKVIDDDEVRFCYNSPHTAIELKCSVPFIAVIMPLRETA